MTDIQTGLPYSHRTAIMGPSAFCALQEHR